MVHPKVVRSVHYCPTTHKLMERKYSDLTSIEAFPSSTVYPTKVRNAISNNIIFLHISTDTIIDELLTQHYRILIYYL